jgi:hypothetical protein
MADITKFIIQYIIKYMLPVMLNFLSQLIWHKLDKEWLKLIVLDTKFDPRLRVQLYILHLKGPKSVYMH